MSDAASPQEDILYMIAFIALLLILGCVQGPASLLIALCSAGLCFYFKPSLSVSIILTCTALSLAILAGSFDQTYLAKRFDLIAFCLQHPEGGLYWLSYISYPALMPAITGGVFIGLSFWMIRLFWQTTPASLMRQKIEVQDNLPDHPSCRRNLEVVNATPADIADTSRLGINKHTGKVFLLPDTTLNTHMLICGTTGSGKTVATMNLVESFINRALPVIYIDGKGDLPLGQRVISYAASQKRKAWMFSMIGPSCKYHPLASGNFTSNKDKLIALRDWSEPHYRTLSEGYLQMALNIMQTLKLPIHLITIAEMLSQDKLLQAVRSAVSQAQFTPDQGQHLINQIEEQNDAYKNILSLKSELQNLVRSELRPLFDFAAHDPVLTLKQVIQTRGLAYIALSPLTFPVFSDLLGKLIINDLKATLPELQNQNAPVKVLLVIDEFSTLAGVQVLNLLNQGRSMGLHIILTIQSFGDLGQKITSNPDHFTRQMISNCNSYWVHRMNDAKDAETIASIFGTKCELEFTTQMKGDTTTGLGSAKLNRGYVLHPDTIKTFKAGEAAFLDKNKAHLVSYLINRKGPL